MPGQTGHKTRLHARSASSFLGMDAWITSKLNVALIRKLCVSSMCLAYFLDMISLVFVEPGTDKRPVDCCNN